MYKHIFIGLIIIISYIYIESKELQINLTPSIFFDTWVFPDLCNEPMGLLVNRNVDSCTRTTLKLYISEFVSRYYNNLTTITSSNKYLNPLSSSNNVDDLFSGFTLDLKKTSGSPITISSSVDLDGVTNLLTGYVETYNQLMTNLTAMGSNDPVDNEPWDFTNPVKTARAKHSYYWNWI